MGELAQLTNPYFLQYLGLENVGYFLTLKIVIIPDMWHQCPSHQCIH